MTGGAGAAGEFETVVLANGETVIVGSLARRFGALVVDWILCLLIAGLFASPYRVPWIPSAILIVEYGFFIGLFRQTPGMFITSLRCVSIGDGGTIGVVYALIRGLLLSLLIPALIMDKQHRGWHDKVANSIVVAAKPPRSAA